MAEAAAVVAAWLAGVNLAAFLMMGFDKRQAVAHGQRVPEATLLTLAALGGAPGTLLAARRFRHKTRKQPFRTFLFAILAVQAALAGLLGLSPDALDVGLEILSGR